MQRVFKFRAWDNVDYMSKPFGFHDLHTRKIEFTSDATIMQFTGCIDKNGKEIYEGDIVKDDTTGSIWAVSWNAEAAGWTDKQDNPYSYGLYKSLEHCMEVIGNIYENPDMLEEAGNNG